MLAPILSKVFLTRVQIEMKILFGSDTYYPNVNGASYFTQRLATALKQNGNDVHVVCPSQSTCSFVSRRDGVVLHGISSLTIPFYNALRFSPLPFVQQQIFRAVRRIKPDIIHIQDHFFIGRALSRIATKLKIPIIGTNHFVPENLTAQLRFPSDKFKQAVNNWIWRDLKRVYGRIAVLTTPSSVGAQLLNGNGIRRPIMTVSCGVNLDQFNPDVDKTIIKKKYNLGTRPTYMYVGRLDKEKNVDDLIKALPLVRREMDAQLLIVGTGKQHSYLVELAAQIQVSNHVRITGFVADNEIPKALASCDV